MALTPQQRSQIIQGSTSIASSLVAGLLAPSAGAISTAALASGAGVGTAGAVGVGASAAIGGLLGGILLLPIAAGLSAQFLRVRFPEIPIGAGGIGGVIKQAIALRERGLEPVISSDPFSGNVALSTADQAPVLNQLLLEAAVFKELKPTEDDVNLIRQARDAFIEQRAAQSLPTLPDADGVFTNFRACETCPIELRFTPRQVA